jgi:pyruvate carboxylase
VRNQYAAFESDLKGPASEVYLHEMPGGQFTNLKEQARSLGLETRWHEVAQAYADVNRMFGDIVKVTPSSKVVGDMALMMVSQDLTVADVENPARILLPGFGRLDAEGRSRPASGRLAGSLQKKALKGEPPIPFVPARCSRQPICRRAQGDRGKARARDFEFEFASYLMYPKVFTDFAAASISTARSALPTPTYFYGLPVGEEVFVDIEKGKTLVVLNQAQGVADDKGRSQSSSN